MMKSGTAFGRKGIKADCNHLIEHTVRNVEHCAPMLCVGVVDLLKFAKRKLVYLMHVLTSLRTRVKSQSKVDTFFLTFYGRFYDKREEGYHFNE